MPAVIVGAETVILLPEVVTAGVWITPFRV